MYMSSKKATRFTNSKTAEIGNILRGHEQDFTRRQATPTGNVIDKNTLSSFSSIMFRQQILLRHSQRRYPGIKNIFDQNAIDFSGSTINQAYT
jgi:hypothetical protein